MSVCLSVCLSDCLSVRLLLVQILRCGVGYTFNMHIILALKQQPSLLIFWAIHHFRRSLSILSNSQGNKVHAHIGQARLK